jgi:hypothetical protein
MNTRAEDTSGPLFQIGLGDLMAWVGLFGFCFALARVEASLGIAAAVVLAPAQVLTQRRSYLLSRRGAPIGPGTAGFELARSVGMVLIAGLWSLVVFVMAGLASATLFNILVVVVMLVSIAGGASPVYAEWGTHAMLIGATVGILAAIFALVREYRELWRCEDIRPDHPRSIRVK